MHQVGFFVVGTSFLYKTRNVVNNKQKKLIENISKKTCLQIPVAKMQSYQLRCGLWWKIHKRWKLHNRLVKVGVDMTCATKKTNRKNSHRSIIDLTTAIDSLIICSYVARKITWQYSSVNRRDWWCFNCSSVSLSTLTRKCSENKFSFWQKSG